MPYSKKAFSFICLLTLLISACSSDSDKDRVSNILNQIHSHANKADQIYNHALSNMQNNRSDLILLSETLSKDAEELDYHVVQIAVIATKKLDQLQDKELKDNLYTGIEYTHSAYKAKYNFVHDAAVSIRSNDPAVMALAIHKNQPDLEKVEHRLMMAATAFGYVKAQVGLKEK